jgi:hypothetical protein
MLLALGKVWWRGRKSYNSRLVERKIVKMTRVLAMTPYGFLQNGSIVTTWNPSEFHKTASILFWTIGSVFDFGRVSTARCPYSISSRLVAKPALVPREEMLLLIVRVCAKFGK